MVSNQDDKDLVIAVLQGNTEAFRGLVDKHRKGIYYMGLKFFRKQSDAEDFAQDVFLQAYKKLDTFSGTGNFKSWLYRVAYNMAVNSYHSKKPVGQLEDEEFIPSEKEETPEEELLKKEQKSLLHRVLKTLPDRYQLVIKMHFFDGLSYPEISDITSIPVNTIKSHILRAKDQIKRKLKSLWGGGEQK